MIDFGFGVNLGPLDEMDSELIRTWRNNPAIYRWCRQNDLISDVGQEEWFKRQHEDPSIKMYTVFNPEQELVCGVAGLTSIDLWNRRAEFSLYIDPESQQKGLGRGALATLLSHGFKNLGLNVIWGESFQHNTRAIQLFGPMGFTEEGRRREFYFKEGHFIDAILWSITASDWETICQRRATSLSSS